MVLAEAFEQPVKNSAAFVETAHQQIAETIDGLPPS